MERAVATQLISHLTENNLFEPLQSGFHKFHSVETALVKVTNDLLIASDSGCLSILILLDLSAAFDTVDHSLLITRLETVFGVSETVLNWFKFVIVRVCFCLLCCCAVCDCSSAFLLNLYLIFTLCCLK